MRPVGCVVRSVRGSVVMFVVIALAALATTTSCAGPGEARWSAEQARAWGRAQPWRVGANYVPASAVNQVEMWRAATFDLAGVDRELGWAEAAGVTALRVFLHDLVWDEDAVGMLARVDAFLAVADRHRMKAILVLFDSVWDPAPAPGPQRPPRPGVHNSRWVQSPGAAALADPAHYPRLERYVRGIVRAFANDPRVLAWDVWNEPDATNLGSYEKEEAPNKIALVGALLPRVFAWARAEAPSQPLTSALWGTGDWSDDASLSRVQRTQVRESDVLSLHSYETATELERRIGWLERYGRPVLLTEFLARSRGSTFAAALPVARRHGVVAVSWGLVAGKTQTYLPWSTWEEPRVGEPPVWFHDLLRPDGSPFDPDEVALLRFMSSPEILPRSP